MLPKLPHKKVDIERKYKNTKNLLNSMPKETIALVIRPRRLNFQGGSIYVSLPQDWVSQHDLFEKRMVQMSVDSRGRLILQPVPEDKEDVATTTA